MIITDASISSVDSVGPRVGTPKDPKWYTDYIELMLLDKELEPEGTQTLPCLLNTGNEISHLKAALLAPRGRDALIARVKEFMIKEPA